MTTFDELNPDEDSIDSTNYNAFARLQTLALEAEEYELRMLDAWVQGINEAIAWRREYFKLMERQPPAQELKPLAENSDARKQTEVSQATI